MVGHTVVVTAKEALAALGTDHLGGRLRALRQQRGFSLRELADRLEISVSAVSQIERGRLQPSVNRLLAIVSALGVPLARVFDESARDGSSGASATGYVLGSIRGDRHGRARGRGAVPAPLPR